MGLKFVSLISRTATRPSQGDSMGQLLRLPVQADGRDRNPNDFKPLMRIHTQPPSRIGDTFYMWRGVGSPRAAAKRVCICGCEESYYGNMLDERWVWLGCARCKTIEGALKRYMHEIFLEVGEDLVQGGDRIEALVDHHGEAG
jgi:hypothetical protein